jgi:hypothetical protein
MDLESQTQNPEKHPSLINIVGMGSTATTSTNKQPEKDRDGSTEDVEAVDIPELLCTTRVLQNFKSVKLRNQLIAATRHVDAGAEEQLRQAETLERLRKWKAVHDGGLWGKLVSKVQPSLRHASRPSDEELECLVRHHFPTPGDIMVRVVDFYSDSSQRFDVTLRQCIDKCKSRKP